MLRFLSLVILSVVVLVHADNKCPTDATFNKHCSCYKSFFSFHDAELIVACYAVHDDDIETILSPLKEQDVRQLGLHQTKITKLTKDHLEGLHVHILNIDNSLLETVEEGALGSIESLQSAYFTKTRITTIPDITNATSLHKLSIDIHVIREIGPEDFPEANNLVVLEVVSGHLQTINEGAFLSLNKLKTLNLDDNFISVLPNVLTSDNSVIETINLGHNHIEELPPHIFDNEKSLDDLDLHDNLISNFTALPFKVVLERGTTLYVPDNLIPCDKSLCWLTDLMETSEHYIDLTGTCDLGSSTYKLASLESSDLDCSTS